METFWLFQLWLRIWFLTTLTFDFHKVLGALMKKPAFEGDSSSAMATSKFNDNLATY